MNELTDVWVVRTLKDGLHGWFYVAVESEEDARAIVAAKRPRDQVTGAKRMKHADHMPEGEFRPVGVGDYWGPVDPQ